MPPELTAVIVTALEKAIENGNTATVILILLLAALAIYINKNGKQIVTDAVVTIVHAAQQPVRDDIKEVKASVELLDEKVDDGFAVVDVRLAKVETAVSIHHATEDKLF